MTLNQSQHVGLNAMNASRAADREVIANALCEIARKHGATIERRKAGRNPGYHGAGIELRFALNGVGASIDIDDLYGGRWSIISWYNRWPRRIWPTPSIPSHDFRPRFAAMVGDPNPHPHHKASTCPADWYSAAMFMDAGLTLAAQREAFLPLEKQVA